MNPAGLIARMKVLIVALGLLETALNQRILRCLPSMFTFFNDYADDLNYIAGQMAKAKIATFQTGHCFKSKASFHGCPKQVS